MTDMGGGGEKGLKLFSRVEIVEGGGKGLSNEKGVAKTLQGENNFLLVRGAGGGEAYVKV